MSEVTRVSISLEEPLLAAFDKLNEGKGYATRSEAIRDLIRDRLLKEEVKKQAGEKVAVVSLVYDHHARELAVKLIEKQHHHHDVVVSTLHVHLGAHHCLEVTVLRGSIAEMSHLAEELISTKGVLHGEVMYTGGEQQFQHVEMTDDTLWDAAILGAGAAGLMAAIRAGERGRKVVLLEKNKRPGVKILMSGGTRCNITHDTDARGIVREYGPSGKFLHSALAAFSIADTLDFFHAEGVATKVEETGKIFPVSNKAADVLDALVRRLERSGTPLYLEEPVNELARLESGFVLKTPKRRLRAAKVLITTGGLSYPGSGTTGDGYAFAQQMGHGLVPPCPALVPIATGDQTVAELRGITLPDVAVQVLHEQTRLAHRRGSLLFAHFGLSGPVILDVSRAVSMRTDGAKLVLEIDLWPDLNETQIGDYLRDESLRSGKKQLVQIVAPHLPRRVCEMILQRANLPIDRKSAALTKEDRRNLVAQIKHWRLPIAGTLGFKKAEVTAGGVPLAEVDSRTMQSKLVPNLYFAGEVLDLDGPIGGYNFQAAWSTGWLAGSSL